MIFQLKVARLRWVLVECLPVVVVVVVFVVVVVVWGGGNTKYSTNSCTYSAQGTR